VTDKRDDRDDRGDGEEQVPELVKRWRERGIVVRRERGHVGRVEAVMPAPKPKPRVP